MVPESDTNITVARSSDEPSTSPNSDCCRTDFDLETAYSVLARDFTALLSALEVDARTPTSHPATDRERSAGAEARTGAALFRIVGGARVEPGDYPSCVCVGSATGWHCTGVIVHPRIVVTAAHCGPAIARVYAGGEVVSLADDAEIFPVAGVHIHDGYRPGGGPPHDIAVLVLARAVPRRMRVALATDDEIAAATECELAGFGYNDPVMPWGFGVKRWAAVAIERPADAATDAAARGYSSAWEFTAGRKHLGRDTCNGDSGGPAYIRVGGERKLAGLTSRSTRGASVRCGDGGIYTRVNPYREWIARVARDAGIADVE